MSKSFLQAFLVPLALLFLTGVYTGLKAQSVVITGTVIGNDRLPLPGVTVTDVQSKKIIVINNIGHFPIPQDELNANPKMIQNPDWK